MKKWVLFFTAGIVVGASFLVWQYVTISSFGSKARPQPSDTIIVLGAQVRGTEPSPALEERLQWALEAYERGLAPKLILSGAKGSGQISEAEAMKRYLMERGVPEEAMILEEHSYSTRQNLTNSKAIMDREGMKSALVVTHRFHQKRAYTLAKQIGLSVNFFGGVSQSMFEPYWTLRESAAILKTYLGK
jgi:uncharacterized SAM-binding protein YcdF (DUF218 family)